MIGNKSKYTFKQIQYLIASARSKASSVHWIMNKFGISKDLAAFLIGVNNHSVSSYHSLHQPNMIIDECIKLGATYIELKKLNIFPKKELKSAFSKVSDIPNDLQEEGEQIMDQEKVQEVMKEKDGVTTENGFKIKDFIEGINGDTKKITKEDAVIVSTLLTDIFERRVSIEKLKEFLTR